MRVKIQHVYLSNRNIDRAICSLFDSRVIITLSQSRMIINKSPPMRSLETRFS